MIVRNMAMRAALILLLILLIVFGAVSIREHTFPTEINSVEYEETQNDATETDSTSGASILPLY